jgi:hypothetical protein
MKNSCWILISLFLLSCSTSETTKIVRDHGECNVAYLNIDNSKNDTSRVKFIKGVVFDTTATLIHGYIVDSSLQPIQNSDVTLFNRDQRITLLTNNQGEFEIFQNFYGGAWNLLVKNENYICLYLVDVIQTGGQWFYIKLQHK